MKPTGVVRKLDNLGRIVIPREILRSFEIDFKDPMEIYVGSGGEIILKKYNPGCQVPGCYNHKDLIEYSGLKICKTCSTEFYLRARP